MHAFAHVWLLSVQQHRVRWCGGGAAAACQQQLYKHKPMPFFLSYCLEDIYSDVKPVHMRVSCCWCFLCAVHDLLKKGRRRFRWWYARVFRPSVRPSVHYRILILIYACVHRSADWSCLVGLYVVLLLSLVYCYVAYRIVFRYSHMYTNVHNSRDNAHEDDFFTQPWSCGKTESRRLRPRLQRRM